MRVRTRDWGIAALAVLSCVASGCTQWHVDSLSPEQVIVQKHPARVKVVHVNDYTEVLETPGLRADTLVGVERLGGMIRAMAVPLAEVRSLSRRRFSAGATGVLVGGIVATWVLLRVASAGVWDGL